MKRDGDAVALFVRGDGRRPLAIPEAPANSAPLRLDRGESFIVTHNGVPVAELTPLHRHRFVSAAAAVAIFRNTPVIDADRFRADVDAWADQETSPRA